jgi:hypothetical protein
MTFQCFAIYWTTHRDYGPRGDQYTTDCLPACSVRRLNIPYPRGAITPRQ